MTTAPHPSQPRQARTAAGPAPSRRPSRRTVVGALLGSLVFGLAATAVVGPRPPELGEVTTGDPGLAREVRQLVGHGAGYGAMAVALVADGEIRLAGFGTSGTGRSRPVDGHTRFEIGSIGKALTGMVLADLVDAGEVALDQRVGDLVPGTALAGAGDATLAELASHRAGLPRVSTRPVDLLRMAGAWFLDPYTGGPAEVLAVAAEAGPGGGAATSYSNLGVATLGSALATHRGQSYRQVLRQRLLDPLAMDDTVVVTRPAELPEPRATAVTRSGHQPPPWIAAGYAGAGIGVWSTSADLARLATAVLGGTAPGHAATEPRWPIGDDRIGLGWVTTEVAGHGVTWHNGGTGGFRSWLGMDRDSGRAVVVLAATTRDVDDLGLRLLIGEEA